MGLSDEHGCREVHVVQPRQDGKTKMFEERYAELRAQVQEAERAQRAVTNVCCKLPCGAQARMRIWYRTEDPYDFTDACLEHVGDLLESSSKMPFGTYRIEIDPLLAPDPVEKIEVDEEAPLTEWVEALRPEAAS